MENELRERLRRIYVDGWEYWTEYDDYMERQKGQVEVLRTHTAELFELPAIVGITPANINNYYDIECALHSYAPRYMSEPKYDLAERHGLCEYFQLLCSVVAPVVAGVWHRFHVRNEQLDHDMFDFLDDTWFAANPDHEKAALELIQTAEELELTVLGWDMTLKPADKDWPLSRFMPEDPDLRHYLFPGYYDDWAGIVKPVRDT
ncbi:MAG: hypothetical protein AAGC55_13245 [Myxococcota bacterium]